LTDGLLYDIIFIKLILPGVNGMEAAREMRDIEAQMKLTKEQEHFICGSSNEITESKF
jgi:two-component SAPR family response regulator